MANEPGNLPSPQSDDTFIPVDPAISLQNQARLQERERRKNANPPTNADNKFVCTHSEPFEKPQHCSALVFDRKCEWNKHMDKHDRPFRCEHPDCSKLQGFTYPGGLARHEKEVHGKHGGPTAQLVCPFSNCKRSRGKKFTRKENLEEHIKRCHTLEGGDEDRELDESAILVPSETSVVGLLAQSQPPAPSSSPNNNALQAPTNGSFEPGNIDPAIAAAHDAASLNATPVDVNSHNGRKRKATASFVFKSSPYEATNDQPSARGRRRKPNASPDSSRTVTEPNLFEELDKLRSEITTLQVELENRNSRISTLENMLQGIEHHA